MIRKNIQNRLFSLDGSYTVEAALIMPIILGILSATLYMIFFLHDKYIIHVYADRMAQECCWSYVENENSLQKVSSARITEAVKNKYESELAAQMMITDITVSLGTCKKNIFTHIYTGTWRIVGKTNILIATEPFFTFGNISYTGSYQRLCAREWIYANDLKKSGGD